MWFEITRASVEIIDWFYFTLLLSFPLVCVLVFFKMFGLSECFCVIMQGQQDFNRSLVTL